MKKILATLLTISVMFVIGGVPDASCRASGTGFSLIEYLETNEVNSYSEFMDVIQTYGQCSETEDEINPDDITYFDIEIDYDEMIVSVTTMREASYDRSQGASNSASRSYYTDEGIKIFTISVSGSFSYMTGYCNVLSRDGSFTKPSYSTWTSTPTITSGNITASKAYVRIYGIARSGSNSKSYTLTLTCDDTGHFTSY